MASYRCSDSYCVSGKVKVFSHLEGGKYRETMDFYCGGGKNGRFIAYCAVPIHVFGVALPHVFGV